MTPYKGPDCVDCNDDADQRGYKHPISWIVSQKPKLCAYHKYKRKQKEPKKTKRKRTGEAEVFRRIWNKRPHYCEHCNKYLGKLPRVHFFAHIKSKKQHPELRLEESNIELMCFDLFNQMESCHYLFDFGTKEQFEARRNFYVLPEHAKDNV